MATIDYTAVLLTLVIPVGIFLTALFLLYGLLLRQVDTLHIGLFIGAVVALALVAAGVDIVIGIIVVVLAP